MKLVSTVAVCVCLLGGLGCDLEKPEECKVGTDDLITIEQDVVPASSGEAGTAIVPVLIQANVSCLRGSAVASVSTSSGTVNEAPVGSTAGVVLSAVDAEDSDFREGYAELTFAAARHVRVEARLGKLAACKVVSATLHDGAAPDVQVSPCPSNP